ncbi:hypothetical protein F4774DRAFT_180929 [Daldinia eschscholtzii]|nr:hypothetical protein F4774DRAFT_180929 [Daldinia eschscholtzii]
MGAYLNSTTGTYFDDTLLGYLPAPLQSPSSSSPSSFPSFNPSTPSSSQSASGDTLQPSIPSSKNEPIQIPPQLRACEYCGRVFSPQRLVTHQKPKQKSGVPPCTVRYPCAQPGEPGCNKTFVHRKDRMRHRSTVCKHLRTYHGLEPGFKCRCGKTVKRWYLLKNHYQTCRAPTQHESRYICQCNASFKCITSLEEHHRSEMGKVGRPRKANPENEMGQEAARISHPHGVTPQLDEGGSHSQQVEAKDRMEYFQQTLNMDLQRMPSERAAEPNPIS